MTRLALGTLDQARGARRPSYDPAVLRAGIVHLGVGAFHRAHQAVFTDDAIAAAGGDWGIVGLSPRRADTARALCPQDGLFTLETRLEAPTYRIIGSLRRVIAAGDHPQTALDALADREVRVITLTVTEPAYGLKPDGTLDVDHPDVAWDMAGTGAPRTAPGWILAGLARRRERGAGPVTVLSCDNLRQNGRKLREAVAEMARRGDRGLADWVAGETRFPSTMVDAITPASDAALRARVAVATGLDDWAPVQREAFAQWAIEDDFAAGRPAWERAGAEIIADVEGHEALKLHVLNAAHSALAYRGLPRGRALVREAMGDRDVLTAVDAMIREEVAPFLEGQDVAAYWSRTQRRFREPAIDHRLDQIARDGAAKLRERVHPVLIANARAGRPTRRLGEVVRAWIAYESRDPLRALEDPSLFSDPFRTEPAVRAAILGTAA